MSVFTVLVNSVKSRRTKSRASNDWNHRRRSSRIRSKGALTFSRTFWRAADNQLDISKIYELNQYYCGILFSIEVKRKKKRTRTGLSIALGQIKKRLRYAQHKRERKSLNITKNHRVNGQYMNMSLVVTARAFADTSDDIRYTERCSSNKDVATK